MKRDFKILMLIALAAFQMKVISSKPCGLENLVSDTLVLDQSDFVKSEIDFEEADAGKKLTFMGWMKLTDEEKREHPLFRIRVIPNDGEEDVAPALENLIRADYNNSGDDTKLNIRYFRDAENEETETNTVTLPLNEWFHWAVSFDYEKGKINFSLKGKDTSVNEELDVNFQDFFLRQKMEVDVGCFPTDFEDDDGKA